MSDVGDGFDFNHDGRLDAAESAFMNDTLFGDSGNNSIYRRPTYSTQGTYGRSRGLSLGKSIWYGLIIYVLFFGLLGINPGGSGEYLPLIFWAIISVGIYIWSNNR